MFTIPVLSYLAALWILSRCAKDGDREAVDTLAAVWMACTIAQMANGWDAPLPLFVAIDFFGGLWMSVGIRTRNARRVALIFLPMICLNAAVYAEGNFPIEWHYATLAVLSWVQIATAAQGIFGDGIRKYLDNTGRRIPLPHIVRNHLQGGEK